MYTLARFVRLAAAVTVALIVGGILIHLLGANTSNQVVSAVNDAAKWLVQPFRNVFSVHGSKAHIALNWGLAAVVYAAAAVLVARLLVRAGLGANRYPRRPGTII